MVYVYPAIFRAEEKGYSIYFPDVGLGGTQGDSIADGLEMAHDFLAGAMVYLEDSKADIPAASEIRQVKLQEGEFASLVAVDVTAYRKKIGNRMIKKTLTIPSWLNIKADEAKINFSQLLQKALKEELNLG